MRRSEMFLYEKSLYADDKTQRSSLYGRSKFGLF